MKFNTMSDHDVVVELFQRIRARRIALKISQDDLASAAGIGIATLKRIEGGQTANLMTTVALIRALGGIEQLESLFFSSQSTGTSLADTIPTEGSSHRVRKKKQPAHMKPPTKQHNEEEHNYLLTAQNNVSWTAFAPSNTKIS